MTLNLIENKWVYEKKSAGVCLVAYPTLKGSRIAYFVKISNAEAHAR